MNPFPLFNSILLTITILTSVFLFYKATNYSRRTLLILIIWLTFQGMLGLSGFYTITDSQPPRFLLLVAPAFSFILVLLLTTKGRNFIDNLDLKTLTILHIVRLPIEIVLMQLFMHKAIPQIMTFEGRNFDIISGLSSPIIYYFVFIKNKIGLKGLLIWNLICFGLLLNIVVNGILSVPSGFQQFAFDQPNIALLFFPFVWIPSCGVALVFLSHLAAIRQILNIQKEKRKISKAKSAIAFNN